MKVRETKEVCAVGSFIRQKRKSLGLTQEEVAARLGVSRTLLSSIEAGRSSKIFWGRVAAIEAVGESLFSFADWVEKQERGE